MANNTIIQQGHFTSDGTDALINLRSDIDWIEVVNRTNVEASTQWAGTTWRWERGMGDDDAFTDFHAAASQAISTSTCSTGYNGAVYRGITLIDTSDKTPGAAVAITAGTNATQPLYSTADTGNLIEGSIVRIYGTDQRDVNGFDFTVDTVTLDTSFRLANTLATAPGVVAGAAGYWRFIAASAAIYDMMYPAKRVIANITQAAAGVVTTLVDHNYVTGQKVRINIPSDSGMIELDGQLVTVTNIDAGTFSIDVATTTYTAFTYPVYTVYPFTPATVIPVGTDISVTSSTYPAEKNAAYIGVMLGTSDDAAIALGSPGGTAADVIYWRAGKSFNVLT